ncbi:MAG: LPXTG cell wall anchor domain-containing protein, partial [Clostridia bacterium]|nr:LPXTG cell wall anchor domain-containing protein [Clostridia bacterium]
NQFVFSKFAEDTSGVFKNVRFIGAEFQLYKIEDGTRTLVNFTTADATNDGAVFIKYIVAEQAVDGVTVDTLKVHEAGDETITLDHLNFGGHRGDVVIFGLSEGKYELVETKAPDGYILPKTAFSVEIIDAIGELGSVGTLSVTSSHDTNDAGSIVNTNGMGELILTVWADITNAPGSALPETGGMGTTLFTVLGIVLMAGAIAFFTSRKRSSVA